MFEKDTRKNTAIKILNGELNIYPNILTRFTTGYCHSVYYIETDKAKYVLRITEKENEWAYNGSIKWFTKLNELDIPVPKILKHGWYDDVFYNFITFINGKDLGDIYHTLNDLQKRDIVRELTIIQRKVAGLAQERSEDFNYDVKNCMAFPCYSVERSRERIMQNKIFDINMCDKVLDIILLHSDYFLSLQPVPFLNDISTKNVLIYKGKLAGIVDIDEMEYGDPLSVIGLTNMALLSMEMDTKYIDYWLEEMDVNETQRKAVTIYTLISCIDFMGEQGMRFNNDIIVPVSEKKIELLKSIYNKLMAEV